jgi:hypothetical protein
LHRDIVLREVTAMPADDSLFEKALARQLRNRGAGGAAGTNGEAASDGPFAEQDKHCPDVELLAAYHERSLANDEMSSWKEHVSSCARCQEILSQIEATENILVSSEQDQAPSVVEGGIPMHELPQFARRASVPAAASEAPREAAAKQRSAVRYWVVPGGAIAAALLVWMAIHPRSGNVASKVEQQMAENRQPTQPIPDQSIEAPLEQRSDSGDLKSIPGPKVTYDRTRSSAELDGLAGKKTSVNKPSPMIEYKTVPRVGASAGVSGGAAFEKSTAQADASAEPVAPKAMNENMVVTTEAPAVTAQVQVSGASQAPLPSGQELPTSQMAGAPPPRAKPQNGVDKAKDQEAQARDAQDAATSLMTLQRSAVAGEGAVGLRNMAAVQNIHMIPAPGGSVIWRVGLAGLIEESANAGASWTRQNSGVSVSLDSGTAPSEAVCWVFGRTGTILRTIDGGAHWTKIISPIAGDVGGVLAPDALHAMVWDAGKKNNFVTADGGATWKRVTNP